LHKCDARVVFCNCQYMIVPFSYPYFQGKKKKLLNSNKSSKSTARKMGSSFSDFVDDDSALQQVIY
jgi:hypothetical protein